LTDALRTAEIIKGDITHRSAWDYRTIVLLRVATYLENPEKSGEFDISQGKVWEIVVCLWCAIAVVMRHKINIT